MVKKPESKCLSMAVLVAAVLALPLDAQEIHPWSAFIGCWTPAGDEAEESGLCFGRAVDGVEMSTVVGGNVASTEVLVANGQPERVQTDGCMGSRILEFSSDGRRAFARSRMTCDGETRTSSGVMAFLAPDRWADVRSVQIAGEQVAWLEEYRLANRKWFVENGIQDPSISDQQAVLAMRQRASQAIGTEEVEEAASRISTSAVVTWVAVQPSEFDLDGDEIVRLADGGIPASLIDVMVAVSYPDRFAVSLDGATTIAEVEPPPARPRYPLSYRGDVRRYLFDPFFLPGPYYRYRGFGYSPYTYYGYGLGRFPTYVGNSSGRVVVQPREPASQGRMVNGQGYRRRTSSSPSATSSGSNRRSIPSSSTSSRGSSSPTVRSSPVTSSSGLGSSSESSSPGIRSSGGRSTSRTARPRN